MCLEFGGFEPLYAQTCDDGVVPTVMMIFLRLLDMANGTEGQLLIIGGSTILVSDDDHYLGEYDPSKIVNQGLSLSLYIYIYVYEYTVYSIWG